MGKTYIESVKYIISIDFEIIGVVDKPDIFGAVFGQSEGLLGDAMDLRELQQSGRVGRIDLNIQSGNGKVRGVLTIPTSMDMVETCILAAAVETVDKVGPFEGWFKVKSIEDTRSVKRHEIIARAKTLLQQFHHNQMPDTNEIAEQVRTETRAADILSWGPDQLPAGPGVKTDPEIIVVEGRADVLNLLKNHIKNVVAMNGSRPSAGLIELCKRKTVTLFVDGDRGGELNFRQLLDLTPIAFVARAPDGKEVEELTRKEIIMALRRRVPSAQAFLHTNGFKTNVTQEPIAKPVLSRPVNVPVVNRPNAVLESRMEKNSEAAEILNKPIIISRMSALTETAPVLPKLRIEKAPQNPFEKNLEELKGSFQAQLLDENQKVVSKVAVRDLLTTLTKNKKAKSIVFDGIVTKRLVEEAQKNGITQIAGVKRARFETPTGMNVWPVN